MNIITTCAIYKGDATTERGLRYLKLVIPGTSKRLNIVATVLILTLTGEIIWIKKKII